MKKLLFLLAIICVITFTTAQWATQKPAAPAAGNAPAPAFHATPPPKGEVLPAILTEQQLANAGVTEPVVKYAYKAAAKAPRVMYQQPCYCYCDRNHGHKSLHTCFESEHGANCSTCMQEALFAEQETKKGKTPAQIRAEIIHGDYKKIDLAKLNNATQTENQISLLRECDLTLSRKSRINLRSYSLASAPFLVLFHRHLRQHKRLPT